MVTALEMKPEAWRKFNPSKNLQAQRDRKKYLKELREKALRVAEEAANLLRKKYGAQKIVLFGSLTNEDAFSVWSDIDLAAWGITPGKFYSAVADITGLSPLFEIDLVEPDNCRAPIKEVIYREGVEI